MVKNFLNYLTKNLHYIIQSYLNHRYIVCERKCGTFQKWTIHRGIRRGKNQAVPGSQGTDAKAPSDSENAPQVQVLSLNLTQLHSIVCLLYFAILCLVFIFSIICIVFYCNEKIFKKKKAEKYTNCIQII